MGEYAERARSVRKSVEEARDAGFPLDHDKIRDLQQEHGNLSMSPGAPKLDLGIDGVHDFDTPIDIGPEGDPLWQPTPAAEPPINAWELEGAASTTPAPKGDSVYDELRDAREALRRGPAADRALPQQAQLTTKVTDVPVEPVRPRTQEPVMVLLGVGVRLRQLGLVGAVVFAGLVAASIAIGSGLARPSALPLPAAAAPSAQPSATSATAAAPTAAPARQATHPVGVAYAFGPSGSERCAPPYMAPKIAGFYTQTTTVADGTSTTRRIELAGGTLVGEIQIFRYDPQSREPIGSPERVVPFSVVLEGAETQLERVIVPRERMSRIVVTSWNGQPARANGLPNLFVPACS